MKHHFAYLLILFTVINSEAQNWGQQGTQWYYSDCDSPFCFAKIIESTGDTTINSRVCRKIKGGCSCGGNSVNYMYLENRRIYWYNEITKNFHVLYDFNANKGDTLSIVAGNPVDSFKVLVDSISSIVINNKTLKVQHFSNVDNHAAFYFGGTVIENIGNVSNCLFPLGSVCDPWTGPLRCFVDQEIGHYTTVNYACYKVINLMSNPELTQIKSKLIISPNPVKSTFSIGGIDFNSNSFNIEIFDVFGKKVLMQQWVKNEEINIITLPKGLYWIKLSSNCNQYINKLLKE